MLDMVDPVDEYAVQQLKEFEGNKLISVTKKGLQLDEDDDERGNIESKEKTEGLFKLIK